MTVCGSSKWNSPAHACLAGLVSRQLYVCCRCFLDLSFPFGHALIAAAKVALPTWGAA